MNQKQARLAVGAVAVLFGIGAFVGMKNIVGKPQVIVKSRTINAVNVLVASSNIGLGDVAKKANFRWMAWPKDALGPDYIRQTHRPNAAQNFVGSIARSPIMKGEPISPHKLIKAGEGGVLAAILEPGMRAISIAISGTTAVGRMILPNDHVDVILTRRLRGKSGGSEHAVDTLLRNVRVLAIGQVIEAKDGKKSVKAETATLSLTPSQTELLVQGNAMGKISLALRSVADSGRGNGPSEGDMKKKKSENGNSVNVLRYGVKSRTYGVN